MCEVTLRQGDLFLEQGQEPDFVFILLAGRVKVYHLTLNGIHLLEYIYTDGELFGEIEVLNSQPVIADVRACEPCRAIRVDKAAFLAWMRADPEFAAFIASQAADKLYTACLNSAVQIAFPLKYRVMYYLWHSFGTGQTSVGKADLVAGLGSSERSVNRILQELAVEGLVSVDAGTVIPLSVDDLLISMRQYE